VDKFIEGGVLKAGAVGSVVVEWQAQKQTPSPFEVRAF
jgi:hypothetical protein